MRLRARSVIAITTALVFVGTIVGSQLAAPAPAKAAVDWRTATSSERLEWVASYIMLCVNTDSFPRSINSIDSPPNSDQRVALSDFAQLGSNNEDRECETIHPQVSRALFDGNTRGLLNHLYAKGQDGRFYLRDAYIVQRSGEDGVNTTAIKNEMIRLAQVEGYYNANRRPAMPYMYRHFALRDHFNKCFVKSGAGSAATLFTIPGIDDRPANRYEYRNGDVVDDNLYVGFFVDFMLNGQATAEDGEWTCEEFADYIKANPGWFSYVQYDEQTLFARGDARDREAFRNDKYRSILGKIQANPEVLSFCVTASPAPAEFKSRSLASLAGSIAESLTDETTIRYSRPVNPTSTTLVPVTLDQTASDYIQGCIVENIPSIQADVDREFTSGYRSDNDDSGSAGEPAESCENSGGVLAWITCPMIDLISTTFNWVDTQIQALLGVDREKYTDDNMYAVWAGIRNIAFAILIIIMLIMVIGTAVGTQVFDAYTVKRAFPRMVAAILFIAFSWYIVIAMIDLSNIVGNGVLGIMTSPFVEDGQVTAPTFASLFQSSVGGGGATGAAATAVGFTAIFGLTGALFVIPGALGILLGWLATALLIIGLAFLVLVLRQMMIIALMIFAPIAILSWIFPGNDKLWKFWWSTFTKLLIMFPMIMALIAAGRIFSFTIAGTSEGILNFIIKLSAYVIPYLLIPMTFKFAGGMLASISGMANDRSRGVFDRLKKGRQERMSGIGKATQAGNLFGRAASDTRLSKWNKRAAMAANLGQGGIDPRRWRTRMNTALYDHEENEVEEILKDPSMTWAGDDAKVHAARQTTHEGISRALQQMDYDRFGGDENKQDRENAIEQILRSQQKFGNEAFQKARVRAQAKTGTGYQDEYGNFNAALMLQDINEAYGEDRNGAGKALAEMRGALTQSGQIAGQAGYGTWAGAMEKMYNGGNNATNAVGQEAHKMIMQDTIDSVNPGYAVHGKPSSARALGDAHRERIQNLIESMNNGTDLVDIPVIDQATGKPKLGPNGKPVMTKRVATMDDVQGAVAAAAGILDGLTQASPQNASAFAEELMLAGVGNGFTIPGATRQVPKYDENGTVLVDANGAQVMETVQVSQPTQVENVRELITHFANMSVRDAPAFHSRRKEYNSMIEAAAGAQGAAAAAAQGPGGGTPTVPSGPPTP